MNVGGVVSDGDQKTISSFFDIATFLALASDPKAYQAKLDELNGATTQYVQAKEASEKATRDLIGAQEVSALLITTRQNQALSENAITEAQARARDITLQAQSQGKEIEAQAQQRADQILADANAKLNQINQRSDALAQSEADLARRLKEADEAKLVAQAANDVAVAKQQNLDSAKALADAKYQSIVNAFEEFVTKIR